MQERIEEQVGGSGPPPAAPVPSWHPSPWLRASALLHAAALGVAIVRPGLWPWCLGAVLANHAQVVAAGLWPRSRSLGVNWSRLPAAAAARGEVAITIDDGPDPEVTPRVLSILAAHAARANFFCIGELIERHPAEARACLAAGHALENHSYHHHLHFSLLGPTALRQQIVRGQRSIEALGAPRPRCFRAPAGLRNLMLDPVLQRMGLQLVSWTRRGFDTRSTDPDAVLARLTRRLGAGDILLLHDGHAARTRSGTPVILEVLPRLLELLERRGLVPVLLREALP